MVELLRFVLEAPINFVIFVLVTVILTFAFGAIVGAFRPINYTYINTSKVKDEKERREETTIDVNES